MFDHQFNFSRLLNEPDHFLNAPKHLKDNKAFIEQCAQESTGDFFVYVDKKFKQDENFVFNCASLYATPQYLKAYKGPFTQVDCCFMYIFLFFAKSDCSIKGIGLIEILFILSL